MRIALFVHCYYPEHFFGTEAYTRQIAKHLLALGHEPHIVTATFAGEARQASLIERYRIDDIPVYRIDKNVLPHSNLAETYLQPNMAEVHTALLREIAPDVVHVTHLINHTASLIGVCERLSMPMFATFTDFFGFCFNNKLEAADGGLCNGPSPTRSNCIACLMKDSPPASPARRWFQGPLLRPLVSRALAARPSLAGPDAGDIRDLQQRPDRLVAAYRTFRAALAPSRFLQQAYLANGFENLVLSHFGIDIDRKAKPTRPNSPVRLGYIGQLGAHKGVHLLIDALREIGGSDLTLSIYGSEQQDPNYSADLRQRAQGLPVSFEGTFAVEKLAHVLAGLDVVVIPSTWYENSPLILLQALATHTPVVVSDVAGLTEFISEGENGFAFRRGDRSSLATILRRFAEAPELAHRMSLNTQYERTPGDMVDDLLTMFGQYGVRVRVS